MISLFRFALPCLSFSPPTQPLLLLLLLLPQTSTTKWKMMQIWKWRISHCFYSLSLSLSPFLSIKLFPFICVFIELIHDNFFSENFDFGFFFSVSISSSLNYLYLFCGMPKFCCFLCRSNLPPPPPSQPPPPPCPPCAPPPHLLPPPPHCYFTKPFVKNEWAINLTAIIILGLTGVQLAAIFLHTHTQSYTHGYTPRGRGRGGRMDVEFRLRVEKSNGMELENWALKEDRRRWRCWSPSTRTAHGRN